MTRIELFLPGLLAVPARLCRALELPGAPELVEWHARATIEPASSGRFGFVADCLALPHAPLAALAWLGATGERPGRQVLFATPVHFEAGMDDLVLFAGSGLDVSNTERMQLADDLREFFGNEPEIRVRGRNVFLLPPEPIAVRTEPLQRAQGHAVRGMLAGGDDARRLNAWLNEMQMFLHDHEINRRRSERRKLTLNGLWPWGEGELPAAVDARATVHAQSDVLRGLGHLLGESRTGSSLDDALNGEGRQIVERTDCIDALDADDIDGWRQAVKCLGDEVLAPVLDWLGDGNEAVLHAGDGNAYALRGRDTLWRKLVRSVRKTKAPMLAEEA